jgi:hypothetical protein
MASNVISGDTDTRTNKLHIDIRQSLPVKEIKMRVKDEPSKRIEGLINNSRRGKNKRRRNLKIV